MSTEASTEANAETDLVSSLMKLCESYEYCGCKVCIGISNKAINDCRKWSKIAAEAYAYYFDNKPNIKETEKTNGDTNPGGIG